MTLGCQEAKSLIPWLLDDELDPEQSLEVEAHVGGCNACRELLEHEGRLRLMVRRAGRSVYAPSSLRRRVRDAVDAHHAERRGRHWLPAAIAAAILMAFVWKGTVGSLPTGELAEVAARHARDLPMDVVAADASPIESYFSTKLPFAMHVPQLGPAPSRAAQPNTNTNTNTKIRPAVDLRVKAMGGRIIHLGDRDAAHLRYDTPRGRLSLFIYQDHASPAESAAEPYYTVGNRRVVLHQVRGFTTARWHAAGLVYALVSDLPEGEVESVVDQLR